MATSFINSFRYAAGIPAFGGASRDFNGSNQYIDIASSTPNAAPVTLAAWINFDTTAGNQSIIAIEGENVTVVNGFVMVSVSGTIWGITIEDGSFDHADTTTTFSTGTWYHIVAVFTSSTDRKIYVNGNATPEGTNTTDLTPNTTYMERTRIADRANTVNEGTQYFNGKIADVRVYDRAISTSEISDLYNFTHVSSGLVGWWLLDADDVLDYAGDNDGTNQNGAVYSTDGPADA